MSIKPNTTVRHAVQFRYNFNLQKKQEQMAISIFKLTDSDGSGVQNPKSVATVGLHPVRGSQSVAVTFSVVRPIRVRCQFWRLSRAHVQRYVIQRRRNSYR